MKLVDLQQFLRCTIAKYRSCESILSSPIFQKLWEESTSNEKTEFTLALHLGKKADLLNWIRKHRLLDLEGLPCRELMKIARMMVVPNYSRLSKAQLISEIKEVRLFYEAYKDFGKPNKPDATTTDQIES